MRKWQELFMCARESQFSKTHILLERLVIKSKEFHLILKSDYFLQYETNSLRKNVQPLLCSCTLAGPSSLPVNPE